MCTTQKCYVVLNKYCKQHSTKHQLYCHLPPISQTIQVRPTRHAEHSYRSKNELITDVLLWTLPHRHTRNGRTAKTYIYQHCKATISYLDDLPRGMNERNGWEEKENQWNPCDDNDDDIFEISQKFCMNLLKKCSHTLSWILLIAYNWGPVNLAKNEESNFDESRFYRSFSK